MPDTNTPTNDQVTKIISLDNLETYTGYVERKGIDITYAEYQQLTPAEKQGKTYYIIDYDYDTSADASDISYDNTDSGLDSTNVQDAVDELKELIDEGGSGSKVQSDWDESSSSSPAFIKNKPTLGTASNKDVPSSGNASTSQVVMGNDTRLSDSRPASDVSAWAKASTKPSYTASEVGAIATTEKGANNGVAELDSTGKVPSSQLPSYVDDAIEYDSQSVFPVTGESGKIYIAKDTNKTYRWSGTAYVEISESLALGETSSTAYAGNKGKANADAISAIKDGTSIDSFADVETALAKKVNVFTGTQAAWAQLSTAEKKAYQRADFTDDYDNTAIGDLTALHTSAKSSIVNAINEVADGKQNSTDNNLQTTSKTIVGGINEVKSGLINIGTTLNGSHNTDLISVDNATATDLGSVALTAGKWLLIAAIDWAPNGTGYRQIAFSSGINPARNSATTTPAIADTGKETYHQVSRVYEVVTAETVTLYGYQTSGAALNAMPYIKAIKISA